MASHIRGHPHAIIQSTTPVSSALVTDNDHSSFVLRLTDANSVLITLDAIEKPELRLQFSFALQEARLVYLGLLAWQQTATLSTDEADRLQSVIDRLRARLSFFGQNV